MFLGFGSTPKVDVNSTTPALNEYSVFGPTNHEAQIQVSGELCCITKGLFIQADMNSGRETEK